MVPPALLSEQVADANMLAYRGSKEEEYWLRPGRHADGQLH
jgi:hypothetical protein